MPTTFYNIIIYTFLYCNFIEQILVLFNKCVFHSFCAGFNYNYYFYLIGKYRTKNHVRLILLPSQ